MPSYEYVCNDCKKEFIVFLSLKELESNPRVTCPGCGSDNVTRRLAAFIAKTDRKS